MSQKETRTKKLLTEQDFARCKEEFSCSVAATQESLDSCHDCPESECARPCSCERFCVEAAAAEQE